MKVLKVASNSVVNAFNKEAQMRPIVMVGFFMEGCPACMAFKPEWNKFLTSCKNEQNPDVLLAEVSREHISDVDFDTSELEGFPTIFLKNKGDVHEYKGARNAKSLEQFLKMATMSSPTLRLTSKQRGGKKKASKAPKNQNEAPKNQNEAQKANKTRATSE